MKFSAVISTFNRSDYLPDLLSSIERNEVDDVVIVEAGGIDAFEKLNKLVSELNLKVFPTILWEPGCSLGRSRNIGAANCRYDYILFADDDDIFADEKVATLSNEMKSALVCTHDHLTFYDKKTQDNPLEMLPSKLNRKFNLYRNLSNFWSNSFGGGSSIAVKKSIVESIPFNEEFRSCEDVEWYIRLALCGIEIKYIPIALTYYRMHNKRMTSNRLKNVHWELRLIKFIFSRVLFMVFGLFLKTIRTLLRLIYK